MGRLDERISAEFARWEQRGRGWRVWPAPVRPEPPFAEFTGYRRPPDEPETDDGRKPGLLAALFDSLERKLNPAPPVGTEDPPEPEPVASAGPLTVELVAALPAKLEIGDDALRAFLSSLHGCREPVAFELLAEAAGISLRFVASAGDAPVLQRQLAAFLPRLTCAPTEGTLTDAWRDSDGQGFIAEFGLAHEFMLPLATAPAVDPFVGLVAALGDLQAGEVAVYQVLFQPVQNPWPGSVWRAVTDPGGKALFCNRPPLIPGTKAKVESPLFGVVVRTAAQAADFDRAVAVVRDLAEALRAYAAREGNRLIPLANEDYDYASHEADLLARQSRRSGMLLNLEELLALAHPPGDDVQSARLRRQRTATKAAPPVVLAASGLLLGFNRHAGRTTPVRLAAEQRTRHLHCLGASGTGKSTFLFNLIQQDIQAGEGVAVFDPHGDLIDRILGGIPGNRVRDVVLLDPSDETASIGFNILSAHSDLEKTLLASDLVSVFARLSTSWGDQMEAVLRNAILAFLESSRGGTLADLRRFLLDPKFRDRFLATVHDPDIRFYWRKGFAQLTGNRSLGPVLTRLETFLAPKPIRYLVSQPHNRLDFAAILDSGKIFLAKLSQGAIGKENAYLLGSLLMAKFQQTAMARQRQAAPARRDFFIYLDEFQNFITPSLAEILSGARKYRVGLILAHQELRQLERDREVASAVLSNPYTRVVFRVGDEDARKLEGGFGSFTARDLQNLGTGEAVVRVERSDYDFNLSVSPPEESDPDLAAQRREEVTTRSRATYATPRSEIEAALQAQFEPEPQPAAEPEASSAKTATGATDTGVKPPAETSSPLRPPESKPPVVAPAPPHVSTAEVPQVAVPLPNEPKPPPDLGRGGEQHKAIQKRLKEAAEKLGYLVTAEKPVLDKTGSVDLALESPRRSIAVEITVTTTVDHEVGNVTKCLKAGFPTVAVVSGSEAKLRQLREAVTAALGAEPADRVGYFSPDQFLAHLESLAKTDPPVPVPPPSESTRRGYTVKRSAPKLSPEELKAKEAAALKILKESMKQPPKAGS